MFCQNCGAELTEESQKFCQSCGSEIEDTSEEIPEASEPTPEPSTSSPVTVIEPTPISTVKPVSGETPYSKRVLGFAIASLVVAITTMIVAFNMFILRRVVPIFSLGVSIPALIGIVSFYILGLIFG
ncbi:MAG: zinc-ribbon domain-containing protein, partial [Promethearchaeota archaeon]